MIPQEHSRRRHLHAGGMCRARYSVILFILAASYLQLLLFTFPCFGSTQLHDITASFTKSSDRHPWGENKNNQTGTTTGSVTQNNSRKEVIPSMSTEDEYHPDEALTNTTTSPSASPTLSPTNKIIKQPEDLILERPVASRIPLLIAIPSVPRHEDADYLLQVLNSMQVQQYPASQIYVFFNGRQDDRHIRWEESYWRHAARGVHFLWNEAPPPDAHPSIYNKSVPLPDHVNGSDSQVDMALGDSKSRKEWRRKEVHDFLTISKYMLRQVYGNDTRPRWKRPEKQRQEDEPGEESKVNGNLVNDIVHPSTDTEKASRLLINEGLNNSVELSSAIFSNHSLNDTYLQSVDIVDNGTVDEAEVHQKHMIMSLRNTNTTITNYTSNNATESRTTDNKNNTSDETEGTNGEMEDSRHHTDLDNTWIIFNQDDGLWYGSFFNVLVHLRFCQEDVVDFFGTGMVSIGFRASVLSRLVDYADHWIDFKPVDWILNDFLNNVEHKQMGTYQGVNHIGTISSRIGRIANIGHEDSLEAQEAKSREILIDSTPIPTFDSRPKVPEAVKTDKSPDSQSTNSQENHADTKTDESSTRQPPNSTAFGDAKNLVAVDQTSLSQHPTNTTETNMDKVDHLTRRHPTSIPPANEAIKTGVNRRIKTGVNRRANKLIKIVRNNWDTIGNSLPVVQPPTNSSETNATKIGELQPTTEPSKSTVAMVDNLPDRKPVSLPANTAIKDDAKVGDAIGNSPVRRPTNTSETLSDEEVPVNKTFKIATNDGDAINNSPGQQLSNTSGTIANEVSEIRQANFQSNRIVDKGDNSTDRQPMNHLPANTTITNNGEAVDNSTYWRLTNTSETKPSNLGK